MNKITSDIESKCHGSLEQKSRQGKSKSLEVSDSAEPELRISGLCGSCSEVEKCPFPKEDGGVWHCEGYVETDKRTDSVRSSD